MSERQHGRKRAHHSDPVGGQELGYQLAMRGKCVGPAMRGRRGWQGYQGKAEPDRCNQVRVMVTNDLIKLTCKNSSSSKIVSLPSGIRNTSINGPAMASAPSRALIHLPSSPLTLTRGFSVSPSVDVTILMSSPVRGSKWKTTVSTNLCTVPNQ